PELRDLLRLDDTAFREFFRKSPVKRTGRARFLRNTLIAAGNSGDAALSPDIKPLLDDPSPLVRAMAVWALGRLLERDEFNELSQQYEATETDATVRAEWQAPELSR
ncbi:MAG: HEAT repeat domain-containing protein, partial [Rickettsiales bacterium]